MNTAIKISTDYENFLAQFIDVNDLRFEKELTDAGELRFTLPITEDQIKFLRRFNKVALYSLDGVDDTLIWTGYIEDIEDNATTFTIICYDEKAYLKNKILYANKSYNTTIDAILSEITTEANARAGNSFLSYETNLTDTVVKDFDKGDDYFSILQEISELLDAEWTVKLGKIIFKSTIGLDKSTGADFIELVSNINSPNEDNIRFTGLRRGKDVANAVIGKTSSSYSEQDDVSGSDFDFDRIERSVSFDDGSVTDQTTEYLNLHKTSQREVKCVVTASELDFRDMSVGDIVKVRIDRNNSLLDLNGSLKVIKKTVTFNDTTPNFSLIVSELTKTVKSPANEMANLFNAVKKLQLK